VHGPQPFDADVGVALGRLQAYVAEHLGDLADVRPALEHQRRHRVAQQVTAAALGDPGDGQVPAHLAAEPVRAERVAGRRDEEMSIGADTYQPDPTAPRSEWEQNQRDWINKQMDDGKTIYDCGPDPGRANYPGITSSWYQIERDAIAARSYPTIPLDC
jgi:hypothetical protein